MENDAEKLILVADYGRSGQGWLSYMLCYVLNAKYVEPYDLLRGRKYSSSERVTSLTSGKLPGKGHTMYSAVVKTHEYPVQDFNLTDKIIYLTRDPRDVAVSSYFRYNLIASEEKGLSLKNKIFFLIQRLKITSFLLTAYRWKKHFRMWNQRKDIPAMHHIRYEDVSSRPEETIGGILKYLGVEAQPAVIKEAVELFSFENLSGRRKGKEDIRSAPFRKGIVGDYKNHFSKIHLGLFKWVCGEEAKMAGYAF